MHGRLGPGPIGAFSPRWQTETHTERAAPTASNPVIASAITGFMRGSVFASCTTARRSRWSKAEYASTSRSQRPRWLMGDQADFDCGSEAAHPFGGGSWSAFGPHEAAK